MSLVTTPAVLLRSFAYSESSRIFRFFTPDHGVVGVMARGARRDGGKGAAGLGTFTSGLLTLYMKSTTDLQTLKEFTPVRQRAGIGRSPLRLGGASLAAELVLRHAGDEANPSLYDALEGALDRLESVPDEAVLGALVSEGWRIVSVLGYEPALETCVACGRALEGEEVGRFDFAAGGVRCASCGAAIHGPRVGPGARDQLRALIAGADVALERPRARLQLLGDFVNYHVAGSRPLDSFAFLSSVLPAADA